MATRGGAAALGLESEIGTLERGKWADLCGVDARGPAMHWPPPAAPRAALAQWALNAGRDTVSDVWVAGRHLLNDGEFTRLDWPRLAARLRAPAGQSIDGDDHADIR
jgi:5-methylthioadenosine/S-adenosylhomocysteine deaminase